MSLVPSSEAFILILYTLCYEHGSERRESSRVFLLVPKFRVVKGHPPAGVCVFTSRRRTALCEAAGRASDPRVDSEKTGVLAPGTLLPAHPV